MNETEKFSAITNALWTTGDVAQFLGCTERNIYILRKKGLPSIYVGGLVRFDPERVREWLGCPTRERQLRDIATTGTGDAAECAASDAFKEFFRKDKI
ncbi:MAG: helix-turn-helix domain-containing protein [Verrucomicrobiae bacterium]